MTTAAGRRGACRAPASWRRPTQAMLDTLAGNYGVARRAACCPTAAARRCSRPRASSRWCSGGRPLLGRGQEPGRRWSRSRRPAVAGARGGLLRASGRRRRAPQGVHCLGELPRDALAARAGAASIYALPARYEPFGLSVLEAALSGCALVLGDIASLRETWGDAAVYVPPTTRGPARHLAAADRDPAERARWRRPRWRAPCSSRRAHGRRLPGRYARLHPHSPPVPPRRNCRARDHLLPLAGVRLEPRQRALPARRVQRPAGARPRGEVYEPADAWSVSQPGGRARRPRRCKASPPPIRTCTARSYDPARLDLDAALAEADLVLVHEWNDHALVKRIGLHRKANPTTGCCSTTRTTAA
jgi:hypothetical protein